MRWCPAADALLPSSWRAAYYRRLSFWPKQRHGLFQAANTILRMQADII